LLLLVTLGLFSAVHPAWSQEAIPLQELQIAFLPEYDQPAMLVIYRATLPDGIALPASVTLPIPASVGDPLAVAWRDSGGSLLNARYTRTVDGEWARIAVEAEGSQIQLEYYQPLATQGDRRSFTFHWPGGALIESLRYEVQQPPLATDFEVTPPAQEQRVSSQDQLTYHLGDMGRVEIAQEFTIGIAYDNPTGSLTTSLLMPTSPIVPAEPASRRTPDLTDYLPWAAGGVGLVLVVAGAFLYLRAQRREASTPPRRRHRPDRGEGEGGLDAGTIFCHNCGTRASVTDQFCRQCGTRLRR
jgi:hypothetical protein